MATQATGMIRISMTAEAFEAISAPLGSAASSMGVTRRARLMIWLESAVVDRQTAMRGPGESYSEVILRLVELEAAHR